MRVTAHTEENPNILNQINIDKNHPLLDSVSEALNHYVKSPEPHLNSLQLHILRDIRLLVLRRYNLQNG